MFAHKLRLGTGTARLSLVVAPVACDRQESVLTRALHVQCTKFKFIATKFSSFYFWTFRRLASNETRLGSGSPKPSYRPDCLALLNQKSWRKTNLGCQRKMLCIRKIPTQDSLAIWLCAVHKVTLLLSVYTADWDGIDCSMRCDETVADRKRQFKIFGFLKKRVCHQTWKIKLTKNQKDAHPYRSNLIKVT